MIVSSRYMSNVIFLPRHNDFTWEEAGSVHINKKTGNENLIFRMSGV